MGPQLYRCGNGGTPCKSRALRSSFNGAATLSLRKLKYFSCAGAVSSLLQWGRNFIVAETGRWRWCSNRLLHASMGPQLYRCGNEAFAENSADYMNKLQWGRNFIVAETDSATSSTPLMLSRLQWGRNFIVAETCISLPGG